MEKIRFSNPALGGGFICLLFPLFICSIVFTGNIFIYTLNIASSLMFFVFLFFLLKKHIDFVAINAFLIINYVWFVFSLNFLEFGSYTPELEITGAATGSTVRFVFGISIFLIFSSLGYNLIKYKVRTLKKVQCTYVILIFILLLVSITLVYVMYGTALSNHVDRVVFRTTIAPPGYFQMITVMTFLCYPLGRIRALGLYNNKILDAIFIISIFLLVLGGEKFSLLILAVCLYIISHKEKINLSMVNCLKVLAILFFLSLGVVFLVSTQYENKDSGASQNKLWLVFDRIAQQAQLNYYFDRAVFSSGDDYYTPEDFFSNELIKKESGLQGIRLLMSKSSPVSIFNSYDKTGITFGDGFPAIIYVYFSWISFVFMGILGFVYGVIIKFCKKTLYEGNVCESMILMYLVYNVAMSVFLNGEFSLIFEMTSTKLLSLITLLVLMSYRFFCSTNIRSL